MTFAEILRAFFSMRDWDTSLDLILSSNLWAFLGSD
jgi:hypothetical protein